jgi:hypothetical protein
MIILVQKSKELKILNTKAKAMLNTLKFTHALTVFSRARNSRLSLMSIASTNGNVMSN